MTGFEIKISIRQLKKYLNDTENIFDKKTESLLMTAFTHYVRRLYVGMLVEIMYSRRYKGKWEPIDDEGYLEYIGTEASEIPIIKLIKEAIIVQKIGYNYLIKIDSKVKYPGSKLSLLKVLRSIEFGTSKFNARPIIRKCTRTLQSQILDIWKGWLARKGVV